jgi:hypothetical protein
MDYKNKYREGDINLPLFLLFLEGNDGNCGRMLKIVGEN